MVRGRKLKKLGGDLKAQTQNVISSKLTIGNKMLLHYNWELMNQAINVT
jgi:hypothetical protein